MLDGLRQWLDLTYEDLEKITGIAKNTFHHWRREKATPRPSTVRRLLRVYALAHALVERLGVERAVEWFRTGPRSPLDLLLAGDVEAAENAAHVLLYRDLPRHLHDRIDYSPFTLEPDFEVRIALNPKPLQRATRHPKRGRLPSP
jgi:transcriptional regulator with XRE-family HTH domain